MACSKFLDIKNDVAFRSIFVALEKNKDILIHFLDAILAFTDKDEIKEIERVLSTIMDAEIASKKQKLLSMFSVEMKMGGAGDCWNVGC